mmetsp:Transcript_123776/g.294009  ORF Transcript_123776/g.294009 Transcript_123776/m.294009 type:complete len:215 (+) Transcript_123776:239-883(+)
MLAAYPHPDLFPQPPLLDLHLSLRCPQPQSLQPLHRQQLLHCRQRLRQSHRQRPQQLHCRQQLRQPHRQRPPQLHLRQQLRQLYRQHPPLHFHSCPRTCHLQLQRHDHPLRFQCRQRQLGQRQQKPRCRCLHPLRHPLCCHGQHPEPCHPPARCRLLPQQHHRQLHHCQLRHLERHHVQRRDCLQHHSQLLAGLSPPWELEPSAHTHPPEPPIA